MAQASSNALAVRHQNRQEFFNYTIGKLDHYVGDLVKDEINKKNDGLVEDLVYGRIPMISSKKSNINAILDRQRNVDRKKEIYETMKNLRMRHDAFSKKEFDERMQLLDQKFKQLDQDMRSNPQAVELDQLIGMQKEQIRTTFNLAQQITQAKTREELLREQQQAEEFIKQIKEKRDKFHKSVVQKQKLLDQKHQEMEKKREKDVEEIKEKQKKEKKEQVEKLQVDIKENQEKRRKVEIETQAKVNEILNTKPLFKIKEEVFQEEQEKTFKERQEETQMSIKNLMKSIKFKELEDHKIKYLEAKKLKELELMKERQKIKEDIEDKWQEDSQKLLHYQFKGRKSPRAMVMYEKEQEQREEEERQKEEQKRKMMERMQNYNQYVKEMYYPKVSLQKKEELEDLKNRIKSTIKSSKNISQRQSAIELGIGTPSHQGKSLKTSASVAHISQLGQNHRNHGGYSSVAMQRQKSKSMKVNKAFDEGSAIGVKSILKDSESQRQGGSIKNQKFVDWSKYDRLKPPTPTSPETGFHDKTVDYLRNMRSQRLPGEYSALFFDSKLANQDKIDYETLNMMKNKARYLETKVEREEIVLRNNHQKTVEDEMAVNDMYLDIITAKLKLLDKI